MRNLIRLASGLAVVAAIAASTLPAEAACGTARLITSATSSNTSALFSPGFPHRPNSDSINCGAPDYDPGTYKLCGGTVTYYANGFFWAFGAGNPAIGLGVDNGTNKGQANSNWLQLSYFPYQATIGGQYGHWGFGGTDGCITTTGSSSGAGGNPDLDECMIVVLEDMNGPDASFLAMSTPPQSLGFDFEFTAAAGFPTSLNLVPTPKPEVIFSQKVGSNVNLTVQLPVGARTLTPANGFNFKCHGNQGEIVTGYKVYSRVWPAGAPTTVPPEPPSGVSRATGAGNPPGTVPAGFPPTPPWVLRSGAVPIPLNASVPIVVPCNGGNVSICSTLTFGGPSNEPAAASNPWELKYCSHSSTTITCDPTLADPGTKQPTKLGRKHETVPIQRDKSTPQKR